MKKIITATVSGVIALSSPAALFAAGITTDTSKAMPTTSNKEMVKPMSVTHTMVFRSLIRLW